MTGVDHGQPDALTAMSDASKFRFANIYYGVVVYKKDICFGSCQSHVSFSLLPVWLAAETDGDSVSFPGRDRSPGMT